MAKKRVIWDQGRFGQERQQLGSVIFWSFLKITRKSAISFGQKLISLVEFVILHLMVYVRYLGKIMGAIILVGKFACWTLFPTVPVFSWQGRPSTSPDGPGEVQGGKSKARASERWCQIRPRQPR